MKPRRSVSKAWRRNGARPSAAERKEETMQDRDDVDWEEIVGREAYDKAMREDLESRKHDEFVREFKARERKTPRLDSFGKAAAKSVRPRTSPFQEPEMTMTKEELDRFLHELLG